MASGDVKLSRCSCSNVDMVACTDKSKVAGP
jgi:hypothetical protein